VFGDLRIPGDRPDLSPAASLSDLTDEQLAALAHQNGFAGVTTIDGANATWHHEIDFQPTGGGTDIGRIEPAGDGRMFEHALDDSYIESWSALTPATGRSGGFFAARVERAGRVDQLLAIAGDHFLYARARPAPLPPGDSLADLIAQHHPTRDTLIAYLDCEISYGTTRGWQIERSTLPWLQGRRLAFADRIAIEAGRPVPRAAAAGETWSFPVVALAADALVALFRDAANAGYHGTDGVAPSRMPR
jgi:hypothetical protein